MIQYLPALDKLDPWLRPVHEQRFANEIKKTAIYLFYLTLHFGTDDGTSRCWCPYAGVALACFVDGIHPGRYYRSMDCQTNPWLDVEACAF